VTHWQAKIDEMIAVKRAVTEVDTEKLWPLHLPAAGASEEKIKQTEAALRRPLDPGYRNFLGYVDGWEGFRRSIDLFSTADLIGGQRRALALELLGELEAEGCLGNGDLPWDCEWTGDTYGGVFPAERSLVLLPNLLPIAVDGMNVVVALMVKTPAPIYWFSHGTFQDRYPTFEAFFDAELSTHRRRHQESLLQRDLFIATSVEFLRPIFVRWAADEARKLYDDVVGALWNRQRDIAALMNAIGALLEGEGDDRRNYVAKGLHVLVRGLQAIAREKPEDMDAFYAALWDLLIEFESNKIPFDDDAAVGPIQREALLDARNPLLMCLTLFRNRSRALSFQDDGVKAAREMRLCVAEATNVLNEALDALQQS